MFGRLEKVVGFGGEDFAALVAVGEGVGEFFSLAVASCFEVEGLVEDEESVFAEVVDGAGAIGLDEGAIKVYPVKVRLVLEGDPVFGDEFFEAFCGFV